MKLSFSLVIASVLLVASCNSTPVSSTSKVNPHSELDACVDPTLNVDLDDSSSAPKTQRPSSSDSEQSGYTDKEPGCILPELDEK